MNGLLYFHQSWTDIFNCLSLIDYYKHRFDNLTVIIRKDAKQIYHYFCPENDSVNYIYIDFADCENIEHLIDYNKEHQREIIFHGFADKYRNDKFKDIYKSYISNNIYFVNAFYILYDLDYNIRINNFNFNRNLELENKTYDDFIKKYGNKYILVHDENSYCVKKYGKPFDIRKHQTVYLNKCTKIFFDYIKIIENASEIHLLDSVWATFIYLLNAKYKLFENKTINVYCRRHYKMFQEPVLLPNWNLI